MLGADAGDAALDDQLFTGLLRFNSLVNGSIPPHARAVSSDTRRYLNGLRSHEYP
jgi:hypothetical protein